MPFYTKSKKKSLFLKNDRKNTIFLKNDREKHYFFKKRHKKSLSTGGQTDTCLWGVVQRRGGGVMQQKQAYC